MEIMPGLPPDDQEATIDNTTSEPHCYCGEKPIRVQVTTECPEKGKFFLTCAQPIQRCDLLKWVDEKPMDTQSGVGSGFQCVGEQPRRTDLRAQQEFEVIPLVPPTCSSTIQPSAVLKRPRNEKSKDLYTDHGRDEQQNPSSDSTSVRKRPRNEMAKDLYSDHGRDEQQNSSSDSSSVGDLIKKMESTCNSLKKQKNDLMRKGKGSSARRKAKLIKRYVEAIDKLKKGEQVDLQSLPAEPPPLELPGNDDNSELQDGSDVYAGRATHHGDLLPAKVTPDHHGAYFTWNRREHKKDEYELEYTPLPDTPLPENPKNAEITDKVKRRGKKLNYCMFCKKLVKEYCIHIEKHHKDTPVGKELSQIDVLDSRLRGKLKREITDRLRKKANDIYNKQLLQETNPICKYGKEFIPVKERHTSKITTKNTSVCKHCQGYYKSDRMTIHLKLCKALRQEADSSYISSHKNLKNHSIPMSILSDIEGATEEFKQSVLLKMNEDKTKEEAIKDPLIMKFGSEFFKSRRGEEHLNYVVSKVRDLSNLVIEMKRLDPTIQNLEGCMNPAKFENVLNAVLNLSKYDPQSGQLKIPSVAYRMSHPLKVAAEIAKSEAVREAYQKEPIDLTKANMFKHFLDEIKNQWAMNVGRISTKMRKAAVANKVKPFALEEDIVKVCCYIKSKYRSEISKFDKSMEKNKIYDGLMELLICHIMCLIRRRPVDFKRATCLHYSLLDMQDELIDMVKQTNNTNNDSNVIDNNVIDNCRNFHIFFVPGKNLGIVPIVLTPLMKEVLDFLLDNRKSVGIKDANPKNDKLFLLSYNKIANPGNCLRKIKSQIKLKQPSTFTNNGLRHQAATFSKLHSSHPQYQEFLASMLGHSLLTNKTHYDLPTSILQKMVVCPILHKMTLEKQGPNSRNGPQIDFNETEGESDGPLNQVKKRRRSRKSYTEEVLEDEPEPLFEEEVDDEPESFDLHLSDFSDESNLECKRK